MWGERGTWEGGWTKNRMGEEEEEEKEASLYGGSLTLTLKSQKREHRTMVCGEREADGSEARCGGCVGM